MRIALLLFMIMAAAMAQQQPQVFVLGQPFRVQRPLGPVNAEPWKTTAIDIEMALLEHYSRTHGLEPTAEEIAAFRTRYRAFFGIRLNAEAYRQDLIRNGLDEQQASRQVRAATDEEDARYERGVLTMIRLWKVGGVLYRQNGGGKVRHYGFGVLAPVDAIERFLVDQERVGAFSIPDQAFRAKVWAVFQDKTGASVLSSDKAQAAYYAKPPWEQPVR